jgi:hypothetical protein
MKNIHILPASNYSQIIDVFGELKFFRVPDGTYVSKNKHIYITSDEKIKVGDWYLINGQSYSKYDSHFTLGIDCKKIILTTDTELIADGVQAIDDEFLEWFVKNPSCKSVEVEKTFVTNSGLGYQEYATLDSNFKVIEINAKIPQTSYYLGKVTILNTYEYVINYKIIIPQEEPIRKIDTCYNFDIETGCVLSDCRCEKEEPEFVTVNIESANGKDLGKISYIPLSSVDYTSKQETLEEAAKDFIENTIKYSFNSLETKTFANRLLKCVEFGAKWQEERMYSEEEVHKIIKSYKNNLPKLYLKLFYTNWFQQFKK